MTRLRSAAAAAALLIGLSGAPLVAPAQVSVSINVGVAPPPLPVYEQPPIPGYGYIWAPGYWAWDEQISDYYWVPGTWVRPPRVGLLWTPAWWGVANGRYGFTARRTLAAAQRLSEQAYQKIIAAQQDNEWDMEGHAQKAKDLLDQANQQLKLAAQYANKNKK